MAFFYTTVWSQGLVQTGGFLVVNSGGYVVIDGSQGHYFDTLQGKIRMESGGNIMLPGHWTNQSNSSIFTTNFGDVTFTGAIQRIRGNRLTAFPTLNLMGTGDKILDVNTLVGGGSKGSGQLHCNNRLLWLNSKILVVNNAANNGITSTTGGIVSETDFSAGYGTVQWNVRQNTGNYILPFVTQAGQAFGYGLNITTMGSQAADSGFFTVCTYPTNPAANPNNRPSPNTITNTFNEYGMENAMLMADRFYIVGSGGYTAQPIAIPTFGYNNPEVDLSGGSTNTINIGNLRPLRYNPATNRWQYPGAGSNNASIQQVTGAQNNYLGIWTLADTTICPFADFSWLGNCEDEVIPFTDRSSINSGAITSWGWEFGDGAASSQTNPGHIYQTPGNYNVRLIVIANTGCPDTSTQSIVIDQRAIADFIYDDEPLVGIPVNFTQQAQFANNYAWDFGDLNTSNAANPSHTYDDEGLVNVQLIANNNANCPDTVVKQLELFHPSLFLIPTGFSPGDKDVLNQTFGLSTLQRVHEFEMSIYSRWGELIYWSDQVGSRWDGTYQGAVVMDGNYVYMIRFRDRKEHLHFYKGMVTLVRN